MAIDFAAILEPLARELLGKPTFESATELRWGTHGSLSIKRKEGVWHDHETGEGGGTTHFVTWKTGLREGKDIIDYLHRHGYVSDAELHQSNGHASPNGHARGGSMLGVVVAVYAYTNEIGELLFEVVRYEPKNFRQRRPARPNDPPEKVRDGHRWTVRDVRMVPYRLPDIAEAIANEHLIF